MYSSPKDPEKQNEGYFGKTFFPKKNLNCCQKKILKIYTHDAGFYWAPKQVWTQANTAQSTGLMLNFGPSTHVHGHIFTSIPSQPPPDWSVHQEIMPIYGHAAQPHPDWTTRETRGSHLRPPEQHNAREVTKRGPTSVPTHFSHHHHTSSIINTVDHQIWT